MRVLSTIKPTQNQLKVMAIIAANKDKPVLGAQQISGDANLVGARNLLMKLNAITFTDDGADLTDVGAKLAIDNDIIDDSGQLTDIGNQLATSTDKQNAPQDNGAPVDISPGANGIDQSNGGSPLAQGMDVPPMEGFSTLFKSILLD